MLFPSSSPPPWEAFIIPEQDIFLSGRRDLLYGLLFSAVGLAGGLAPLAAAAMADRSGSYNPAFLLGMAAALVCLLLSRALPAKFASQK